MAFYLGDLVSRVLFLDVFFFFNVLWMLFPPGSEQALSWHPRGHNYSGKDARDDAIDGHHPARPACPADSDPALQAAGPPHIHLAK